MFKDRKIKYAAKYAEVESSIKKYSSDSVFNIAMRYLALDDIGEAPSLYIQNAQWLLFMMIKISSACTGALKMNETDFCRICNSLFMLQDHIIDIDPSNILLKMRPLIYQQSFLRRNGSYCMMSLARQCKIIAGEEFYETKFAGITGVGVTSYLTIWLHIFIQINNKKKNAIFEVNIHDLIYRLYPIVSLSEIANFFKYYGLNYQDARSFFEVYKDSAGQADGYYYDTPLNSKPFLIYDHKIYGFSEKLLFSCFPLLLIETFKNSKAQDVKAKLGVDIEKYINALLNRAKLNFRTEEDLKVVYQENNIANDRKKLTDFAVFSQDIVLIESKAIEQKPWMKASSDASKLKSRFDQDIIKAIVQIQTCATLLSKCKGFPASSYKGIVITYDDFGISNAKILQELMGVDLENEIRIKCGGDLVVPLEKIVYISMYDFEAIASALEDGLVSFNEIEDICFGADAVGAPQELQRYLVEKCGFDIYKKAHEVLKADDKFIKHILARQSIVKPSTCLSSLNLMRAHLTVMRNVDKY